jgi:hypothetical protein
MNLHNRLRRLEQAVGTGCPACRDRRGVVVVRRRRQGMSLPWDEPAPCPRCGEVPEQILEIEEVVVTTREEAQRLWQPGSVSCVVEPSPDDGGRLH